MPNPIPAAGTRISYVGRLGVGAHPEATKYVGTVLPGDTGVVGPPCTAQRLEGWVCTYPDAVRYHGAGVDPGDVEPTAPEPNASVVCHPYYGKKTTALGPLNHTRVTTPDHSASPNPR